MKIFSIKNDNTIYNLDKDTFDDVTKKRTPYYNCGEHFAVCPCCGNPVLVINLDYNKYKEQDTNRQNCHARHIAYDVEGLAVYNKAKYKSCCLKKENANKLVENTSGQNDNGIMDIINNNKDIFKKYIQQSIGVNISNGVFNKLLSDFEKFGGNKSTAINVFNIVYSFFWIIGSVNVYGQYVNNNAAENLLVNAVNKSDFFIIENNRIVKKGDKYAEISVTFDQMRLGKINFKVTETSGTKKNPATKVLLNKQIDMNLEEFAKKVVKNS